MCKATTGELDFLNNGCYFRDEGFVFDYYVSLFLH